MKIISSENLDIDVIKKTLDSGGVLVYPTETCYGLGVDATNKDAVNRLFDIKQRQKDKSVLVLMSDIAMAREYVVWNDEIDKLAQNYWPGPLTLVSLAKDKKLSDGVIASDGTIAFRVTSHEIARNIVDALGKPLVSTSANIARLESPYDSKSVIDMYVDKTKQPDIFIDSGNLPHRTPSTIVKVEDGELIVLRQGEIVV